MSEVIESFIRRHPSQREDEAFEAFLRDERIARWVGSDQSRRDRLRREFTRVWGSVRSATPTAAPAAKKAATLVQTVEVTPQAAPSPPPAPAPPRPRLAHTGPARRLDLICPECTRFDVWIQDGEIGCRQCGSTYDDMLMLIPVKPVGPFEFMFGSGWQGWATAGGIAAGVTLLYALLRGI